MSARDENGNTNRFTITDYTDGYGYGGDEDEEASNAKPTTSNNAHVAKPPRAMTTSRHPVPLESSPISRKEGKKPEGSGSGRSISSSGIRPLPRIPSASTSQKSESPVAGPSSSPIMSSPISISPSQTLTSQKAPVSPSSSAYYTPTTARTMSDTKGKQPEVWNASSTQTRPGRNGSGGSSHHKLQLHEVSQPFIIKFAADKVGRAARQSRSPSIRYSPIHSIVFHNPTKYFQSINRTQTSSLSLFS
jgi:hypothetical protein